MGANLKVDFIYMYVNLSLVSVKFQKSLQPLPYSLYTNLQGMFFLSLNVII